MVDVLIKSDNSAFKVSINEYIDTGSCLKIFIESKLG